MGQILLVDDDDAIASMIVEALEREAHSVEHIDNGTAGSERLLAGNHDLAILDWQLPGMSGVQICAAARKNGLSTPIMMLTSRNSPAEMETGLDTGADDYLTKPFSIRELCARVKVLLRRPQTLHTNEFQCQDIVLSMATGQVFKGGQQIELMPAEHALLEFLMRNKGKAFSAEDLLTHVWKADSEVTLAAVTTCIKRLRNKIDSGGRNSIIQTVHGVGYMI